MALALTVAVASVCLGVVVAWFGESRPGVLGPVRMVALVTSVLVAVTLLLPEALDRAGWPVLGAFAAGLAVPAVFERMAIERRDVVGLEIGFAGLLFHKLGDGIALGTYASTPHPRREVLEVLLGIGAHTVPIVALVFMVFAERRGLRSAFVRAALLAVAAVVGALLAGAAPMAFLSAAEPWLTAAVAGMLLHVVFHDWRRPRLSARGGSET